MQYPALKPLLTHIDFLCLQACEPSEVRLVFVLKCICLLCRMLVGESLVSEM